MKKTLLAVSLIMATSSVVAEEGKSYFGVGYHIGQYEETGAPKANPSGIKLEFGKYLIDNVAIEGQFTLGAGEDTVEYLGVDVDIKVKSAISLFIKGDIDLGEKANLYGLIGFTKGEIEATIPEFNYSVSASDTGLSYGFGVEIFTSNDFSVSGEYISYLSESGYDYSGFNLGFAKSF